MFPPLPGMCWRLCSRGWSGTRWQRHRPRAREMTGRPGCTSASSRCGSHALCQPARCCWPHRGPAQPPLSLPAIPGRHPGAQSWENGGFLGAAGSARYFPCPYRGKLFLELFPKAGVPRGGRFGSLQPSEVGQSLIPPSLSPLHPSWPGFQPIQGTETPSGDQSIAGVLETAMKLASQEVHEEDDGAEKAKVGVSGDSGLPV